MTTDQTQTQQTQKSTKTLSKQELQKPTKHQASMCNPVSVAFLCITEPPSTVQGTKSMAQKINPLCNHVVPKVMSVQSPVCPKRGVIYPAVRAVRDVPDCPKGWVNYPSLRTAWSTHTFCLSRGHRCIRVFSRHRSCIGE